MLIARHDHLTDGGPPAVIKDRKKTAELFVDPHELTSPNFNLLLTLLPGRGFAMSSKSSILNSKVARVEVCTGNTGRLGVWVTRWFGCNTASKEIRHV